MTSLPACAPQNQQPASILTHPAFWASLGSDPLVRHPFPAGIAPADRFEFEQLDKGIPYGFIGTENNLWIWSLFTGELEIQHRAPDGVTIIRRWVQQQTLGSVSTENGGMKRGRYVNVDITDIPDWLKALAEPYIKFPECGEVGVHRLVAALLLRINLNPPGQEVWHVHHKDHDTRNNQIDNLKPLPPALHALEHRDFRWGMAAYNSDGTLGSSNSKLTEADFIWLHKLYAELDRERAVA